MKILHLYSDWRWTGPADPTINLVRGLKEKGIDVIFACRKQPVDHPQSIEKVARERGLNPLTSIHLNRYFNIRDNLSDILNLRKYINEERFDIIHCHLSHDHLMGVLASKMSTRDVSVVRTNHKGIPFKDNLWNRLLIGRWTDGIITFSRKEVDIDAQNFNIPPQNICFVNPAVDTDYFDPEKVCKDYRSIFGFSSSHIVVGMVARMQRHRRFDVFLKAIALARERCPSIKVLILGRGTHMEDVAVKPVQMMGLSDHVVFAGYRRDDYREALACIDFKVFLVPGSDGTCRAVREAMALGKPVIAAKRGILPEIIDHGLTGLVITDTPQELAQAIIKLALDSSLRKEMGKEARRKAIQEFDQNSQSEKIIEFYNYVIRKKRFK
jgi:glycosyltransferase involved in cell wall biosynthesis